MTTPLPNAPFSPRACKLDIEMGLGCKTRAFSMKLPDKLVHELGESLT